jgi:hypothetical protein
MKRTLLACLCGALLATPAGLALGASGEDEVLTPTPASECPEALAVIEQNGWPVPDYFAGACPAPDALEGPIPGTPVLDRAAGCEATVAAIGRAPDWCPSDEEIAEAEGLNGGQ